MEHVVIHSERKPGEIPSHLWLCHLYRPFVFNDHEWTTITGKKMAIGDCVGVAGLGVM